MHFRMSGVERTADCGLDDDAVEIDSARSARFDSLKAEQWLTSQSRGATLPSRLQTR